jgi:hypothetical protein
MSARRMKLAYCLGFRNWYLRHLQRCLESLRTWDPTSPIVVTILDEHPEPVVDVAEGVVKAAREFQPITLAHLPQPEWSRSYALNRAAQLAARTMPDVTHFVFTDADMLFPSTWFGTVTLTVTDAETLWLTRSRDLPPETVWEQHDGLSYWRRDTWLREHSHPHGNDLGQGGAMVVPRAWFERVGGFDEFYSVWGCEDNDLTLRALWSGRPVTWLPDAIAWVAHQWHDRTWPSAAQWVQVRKNRDYLAQRMLEQGPIARNGARLEAS